MQIQQLYTQHFVYRSLEYQLFKRRKVIIITLKVSKYKTYNLIKQNTHNLHVHYEIL